MISVVMGVNRVDRFLFPAIYSIVNQNYKEWELIIIANGDLSNEVFDVIENEFYFDKRIKCIKSSIGQLSYALNLAIDNSSFDYIARMDSDDISHPDRLGKQLEYLVENNMDLVGSSAILINEYDEPIGEILSPMGESIGKKIPYRSCFVHPSVLYKKDVILKLRGYNSGFNSEDYDLWLRMKRGNIRWNNLPDFYLSYRVHSAASQRRILGYAESAGYALREFILNKNVHNFFAIWVHFFKSILRGK